MSEGLGLPGAAWHVVAGEFGGGGGGEFCPTELQGGPDFPASAM